MPDCPAALRALAAAAVLAATSAAAASLAYPPAPRGNQVDRFHGIEVPDPYRTLEDIDAPATRAWVEAEARLSRDYLAAIPGRDRLAARLRQLWQVERWEAPQRFGTHWFFAHSDGMQNQAVLLTTDGPDHPARVLLDPNTLSADGTVAFKGAAYTADGSLMAYGLSEAGSDWEVWRVRDVASGRDLPDEIRWVKSAGAAWRSDRQGFFYSGYTPTPAGESLKAPNQYQKIFYHRLGTSQDQDTLVYTRVDDPDWFVAAQVTDDGRYLVVTANHGDDVRNTLAVADLAAPALDLRPLIAEPAASYTLVGSVGTTLYVQTDDGAPRYRVIAIDLARPGRDYWKTVVAESADTLDTVTLVGGQLLAQYLHDAHSQVRRYDRDGRALGVLALPGIGAVYGFAGHDDDAVTYYGFNGYTAPAAVYRLDLRSGRSGPWRAPQVAGFDPRRYATRQVFCRSRDGTRVPLFIVARKDVVLDGDNPTLLYGYGGFNISIAPEFRPDIAGWLDLGGVYVVATLRGGGEYGRAWHEAGMKAYKQNVFDDFAAAAQYLIERHWTRPGRLAINGRSNGGLLVAATAAQHPERFAAAVPEVGVMDMLRFGEFTVGKGWESDYGSVDDAGEFRALLAYSPYHNVRAGFPYPPMLILTGDHDDRVFPAHSFKYAAALQHADPDGKPLLLRVEPRAGHGAGMPLSKRIDATADIYAFVLQAMGLAYDGTPRAMPYFRGVGLMSSEGKVCEK